MLGSMSCREHPATMNTKYLAFGVLFITLLSCFILQYTSNKLVECKMPSFSQSYKHHGHLEKENVELLLNNILRIGESIHIAEKHVRGMKTAYHLKQAKAQLSVALNIFGMNLTSITKPVVVKSKNICPEKYMGTKHGYPLYETGFIEENCTYSTPLSKLLTILTLGPIDIVQNMILSIQKTHSDVKIIASVNSEENKLLLEKKFKNDVLTILSHESTLSSGVIWNRLLRLVKTEYVFISRDTTEVDEYSRFSRLIREMEIQSKPIASGSVRNHNSRWRIGCYQRAFRNYTLAYYEGYDESVNECLICDHVEGPFIMKTEVFKTQQFNEKVSGEGLFEDFFIRVGSETILNCPDAMFHVNQQERSKDYKKWDGFSKVQEVFRLRFIPGFEINFPCTSSVSCYKGGKYAIHPCCLQELSNMVILATEICGKAPAVCELDSGTLLSAVKISSVFPWEVDGDIIFPSSNRSILQTTANRLKQGRYTVSSYTGYLLFNTKNWFVEGFQQQSLSSEKYIETDRNQTKVLFDGHWLGIGKNPALMARNRYGRYCYQHSVHWRYQGFKTSWITYTTDYFPKCDIPGNHKCINLYRTDGNMQFSDPIP